MDLDYAKKRGKWAVVLGAIGVTFYGAYRVYNFPSFVKKRQRLSTLFSAIVSVAEMASDSADAIGILSRDLKEFLGSDSDQIPESFKQLSKIAKSDEFSESLTRITRALSVGILSGTSTGGDRCFSDRVFDKLFTDAGSGFASVVVGSFARNMVMALFSEWQQNQWSEFDQSVPKWVEIVCDNKCRDLIGDFIRLSVTTAISVYLDKSTNVNMYNEFFSGLTNPNHEARVKDMLVSVSNGAVQSCIQTSYNVWTKNSKMNSSCLKIEYEDGYGGKGKLKGKRVRKKNEESRVMRKFVGDVTGVVTFQTIRCFLEFVMEKALDSVRTSVDVIQQEVVDRGVETMRYASGKSSAATTMCLALCLNILNSPWILTYYY